MNKKDVWLTVAIIAIALMLVFTIATILDHKNSTTALQEARKIEEIDNLITKGATKAAEESIVELSEKDLSAASYIRLIKRAWQISRWRDSYEVYNRVTAAAVNAYPARGDVNALKIYGLLRSGSNDEAAPILADSEIDEENWPKISAEAGLYLKDTAKPEGYALSQQSAPKEFLDMYAKTGSYGFLLDGLLLMLQQGRIDSAYALVREEEVQHELPADFMFQLSFDAENWHAAETILSNHPQMFSKTEYLFLSADLYMYRRDLDKAADIYSTILEADQELPAHLKSRALLNLIYSYQQLEQEIPSKIMDMIRQVSTADPEGSALLFAGYFLANNDTARAQEILEVSTVSGDQSILRQVIREETRTEVNPERYKSLLWRLVYRTEDEKYARYLAWFLIGIEDIEGLHTLIEHSQRSYGPRDWIQFYQGILHMYGRNYEAAVESFKSGYDRAKQWEYLYNAALGFEAAENPNAALDELKAAEAIVPSASPARAAIMARQIELLIHSGRSTEAEQLLAIFESRFPGNMSAGLLRSLLEARAAD